MKVLMINGSPKANGNTAAALNVVADVFNANGIETEIVQVGHLAVRGCVGCAQCKTLKKCVFDDVVNEVGAKIADADGFIVASPVYYASANGTLVSFLDRLFYSSSSIDKRGKAAAAIAVARRGGTTATLDQLNKYLAYGGMNIATSTYWDIIHGNKPGEVLEDAEGIRTMKNLANNMTFLMKSLALGKEAYGLPELEPAVQTNFIR